MTQHIMPQDTAEDQQIMRRLMTVIAGFMAATVVMALVVAAFAG